ncbi:MAG: GNAT family N-acetyltransferase [Deltaproteobacteria bacterium]|nr:GNAT family N-acetyltransferase [Deltaproteobacteria bacterium]
MLIPAIPQGAPLVRPASHGGEIRQALALRRRVFVEEQGLFPATDEDAHDAAAFHLVALDHGRVVGTVRVYADDAPGVWWGGRLAVERGFRGGRTGVRLVAAAVTLAREAGAKRFCARVQAENEKFFLSLGWKRTGEDFTYQGRVHVPMEAW